MENGSLERMSGKEKEDKSGQMDLCMRAGGKIIKPMAREDLSMLMVMFMMGNGSMIRHMDSESTAILTVPSMRANGEMEKCMDKAPLNLQMEVSLKGSGTETKLMAKEFNNRKQQFPKQTNKKICEDLSVIFKRSNSENIRKVLEKAKALPLKK